MHYLRELYSTKKYSNTPVQVAKYNEKVMRVSSIQLFLVLFIAGSTQVSFATLYQGLSAVFVGLHYFGTRKPAFFFLQEHPPPDFDRVGQI